MDEELKAVFFVPAGKHDYILVALERRLSSKKYHTQLQFKWQCKLLGGLWGQAGITMYGNYFSSLFRWLLINTIPDKKSHIARIDLKRNTSWMLPEWSIILLSFISNWNLSSLGNILLGMKLYWWHNSSNMFFEPSTPRLFSNFR